MSTRHEIEVINVKYHGHKATRTLNVTQKCSMADAIVVPSGLKLYPDLCIARDCFMILMLRSFYFNAISRGNQRPNLPYKKACRDIFGGFSLHQLLPETATLLLETALPNIDISLTTNCILQASIQNQLYNITSSDNKSRSYLHIIVSCCGLQFQFLSVPTHSTLPSRSTLPHSTFPTHHRLWDTTERLNGVGLKTQS